MGEYRRAAIASTVAALFALTFSGCSSGQQTGPTAAIKPSANVSKVFSIPVVSEGDGCSGSISVKAASSWALTNGKDLTSTDAPATVRAYCDNRSRYESSQPGLEWTLDSVNQLVWSAVLADPSTKVQSVNLGANPATRFEHSGSGPGSWYLSEDAIIGNDYVGLEAEFSSGKPDTKQISEVNAIFDTAVATVNDK